MITVISLLVGFAVSPYAANFIKPLQYALGSEDDLVAITLAFTRLVLDIQLVICGIQLPTKYLFKEWKSLSLVLGPGMVGMWLCSSLLIWGLVPDIYFVHALTIGACVTPTDPILSHSIIKGSFAEKHVPEDLRNLIVAESGANDGLGYPFLFLGLLLLQYAGPGANEPDGVRFAIGIWFREAWAHQILLGAAYGAFAGFLAQELVRVAYKGGLMDWESLLTFPVILAVSTNWYLS